MLMQKWKWKYNWKYKCVYSFLCTRCIVHQIILLACYSKIHVVALPLLQCVFELASIRQICFWKLVEIMAVGNFPSRDALIRRSSSLIDMEVIVTVKLKQLAMSSDRLIDWLIDCVGYVWIFHRILSPVRGWLYSWNDHLSSTCGRVVTCEDIVLFGVFSVGAAVAKKLLRSRCKKVGSLV